MYHTNNKTEREIKMKKSMLKFLVMTVVSVSVLFSGCSGKTDTIVIGAADFTEQFILGNMLQILIDENTDMKTQLVSNMSTTVLFSAIQSSNVHVYVEYTGTLFGDFLGYSPMDTPDRVFTRARDGMRDRFNIRVLDRIGFNNTYALAVRPDTAERYNLRTFSDLVRVAPELTLGGTMEFLDRDVGLRGLQPFYGMNFGNTIATQGTLRYTALNDNQIQVTSAFSTDGLLARYNLVLLEDDRNFFPAYDAVVVIREDTATKFPHLVEVLNKLTGSLDETAMSNLNYRVDVLNEDPEAVARDFLRSAGLI